MKTEDLKKLAEAGIPEGIEWHGEYHGRNLHIGVAVEIEHLTDLITLGAVLQARGHTDLLRYVPQLDHMGKGYVVSWDEEHFDTEEDEEEAA